MAVAFSSAGEQPGDEGEAVGEIANLLGLSQGLSSELLLRAAAQWPSWVEREPALSCVGEGLGQLREWTFARRTSREWEDLSAVLAAIGRLAADGPDVDAAAATLAWLFLAAAEGLAGRLQPWAPEDIRHIVAARLWLLCRTIPAHWHTSFATRLLGQLTKQVACDCRFSDRTDATWREVQLAPPDVMANLSDADRRSAGPGIHESAVLVDLLDEGVRAGVISISEMSLLLDLAAATGDLAGVRARRQHAGLTSHPASERVALRWGLAPVTVRRRAAGALRALRAAHGPEARRQVSA